MRFTLLIPLLFAAVPSTAQHQQRQQVPLLDQARGWWAAATAKAASALASSGPVLNQAVNAVSGAAASAAAVAGSSSSSPPPVVQRLTLSNHRDVLLHSSPPGSDEASSSASSSPLPGIDTWRVFVTGGNKTCGGRCFGPEIAWNSSVTALSELRGTTSNTDSVDQQQSARLALIDCEAQPVLCGAWMVAPPAILELRVPHPAADQSRAPTAYRYFRLNATTTTAKALTVLFSEGHFERVPLYEGVWHPVDGLLARARLNVAYGYFAWVLGMVPSWAMMVGISLFSRSFLSKRLGNQIPQQQQRPPAAPSAAQRRGTRPAAPR